MPASQQHGFEIEKIVLVDLAQRSKLTKKVPLKSSPVSRFDAPGYSDPYGKGIPTSIKTTRQNKSGSALVCMSDATRIGQLAKVDNMRLLVALYQQKGDKKVVSEMREYIITSKEWKKAIGGVPAETLKLFNDAIKLEDPKEARLVAKKWKEELKKQYPSIVRWNPKIDSKGQRRLQCSIHLDDLEKIIEDTKRIRVFGNVEGALSPRLWGNGTRLPIELDSPPRIRKSSGKNIDNKNKTKNNTNKKLKLKMK